MFPDSYVPAGRRGQSRSCAPHRRTVCCVLIHVSCLSSSVLRGRKPAPLVTLECAWLVPAFYVLGQAAFTGGHGTALLVPCPKGETRAAFLLPPRWPCSRRRARGRGNLQPSLQLACMARGNGSPPLPPPLITAGCFSLAREGRVLGGEHNAPCNSSLHFLSGRQERTSSGWAGGRRHRCRPCCPHVFGSS